MSRGEVQRPGPGRWLQRGTHIVEDIEGLEMYFGARVDRTLVYHEPCRNVGLKEKPLEAFRVYVGTSS